MPPLPSPSTASRLIPSVTRAFTSAPPLNADAASTPPKAPANKDHHIHTYGPEAFPLGFTVASTHCGVKKKSGILDLGILISTADRACSAAACVTRNVFKAAPVTVTNELLASGEGRVRGFIVNSGNANAVTGKKGLEDAWKMSNGVTGQLPPSEGTGMGTLVMSTGVIGQNLPIDKVTNAIPGLVRELNDSPKSWLNLARSFMTTDTFPKLRTRQFTLGGRLVKMAGIDKGAGMIAPNMGPPHATLLGVIATDAAIAPKSLQTALNYAVDRSFNSITVDGDMSTNDTILCLANGAAGKVEDGGRESKEVMEEISEEGNPEEFGKFKEELRGFAEDLAKLVVRDGEGATKFVTVRVKVSPYLPRSGAD
jgi:glutamate N-acetyltransferase/amino-acid N-acetyltransferase